MESTYEKSELIPAAVLIPLIVDPAEERAEDHGKHVFLKTEQGRIQLPLSTCLLFTVRTDTVEHHKGQISFPGGAHETGDHSLRETALRECHEEIGLEPSLIEIATQLPETLTIRTPFRITPFVGIVRGRPTLVPNPHETSQILFIPLRHLLDAGNSALETYERGGVRVHMKAFHYEGHRIWGATAWILQTLLEKFLEV